jgi:hypothetical protein
MVALSNPRRVLVGKVRVHFSKNMDTDFPDRRFHINKGGLRIQTTVTSNPSTVAAYIRFIWKKYLLHAKHRVVGLDCEYTRYMHKKERQKLPLEEQVALTNQEPQRAAVCKFAWVNTALFISCIKLMPEVLYLHSSVGFLPMTQSNLRAQPLEMT